MVLGLIVRLVLYSIALFFIAAGLVFATGSQYGIGTRIGAVGMIFGALFLLPITRSILLTKFGLSIGIILAVLIFAVMFLGFGQLSATASDVEMSEIQSNVTEHQIDTQVTLTNPQSQRVPLNITTTLTIEGDNQTTERLWQRITPSIDGNTTETYTTLSIHRTNLSDSEVRLEIRAPNGTAIHTATLRRSYWSAIQNGDYTITVNISNGEERTYTPTNTTARIQNTNRMGVQLQPPVSS